jgi:hypothetical protein
MNKLTSYSAADIVNTVLSKVVSHHSFSDSHTRQILHGYIAKALPEEQSFVSFLGKLAYQLSVLTAITHSQWCDYLFKELVEDKSPELEYDYLPHRISPHMADKVQNSTGLFCLDQMKVVTAYQALSNELSECHIENAGLLIHFANANSAHANLTIGCLLWRIKKYEPLVVSSPLVNQARKHITTGLMLCSEYHIRSGFKDRYTSLLREAKLKYVSTSVLLSEISELDAQHLKYVLKTSRNNSRHHTIALELSRQVDSHFRSQ